MHARRTLLAGILIGAALSVTVLAPANAATVTPRPVATRVVIANSSPVTGQPWSAPAYPVTCQRANDQISCTPTDPADVKAQQCFVDVLLDGHQVTVCTTYEGHVDAIKTSGGKPLLVSYGCHLGDVVCVTFENAGRGMALAATAMMYVVWSNTRFDTSSLLWTAAVNEWSFWQWAVLLITLGAMIWAIAAAVVSGDRGELIAALIRSFIAVAAVPICLWLTGHLVNTIDDMTLYIMTGKGPLGLFSTLQSVMWAGGQANYFFAFLIHGLLMLAMVLLTVVFMFRNLALAALIAVGPVAWMLFPVRAVGPQWVVRYVSAIVVLLLTGPLTMGFLNLIINGLASVHTIWDPQSWPMLIGLVLVAFAPFAVFGLFSFVGAIVADTVGSGMGSKAARGAGNAARSAGRVPSRVLSHPVGRGTGSSGPKPFSSRPGRVPSGPSKPAQGKASSASAQAQAPSPRRPSGSTPAPAAPPASPSPAPSKPAPAPKGSS